VSIAPFFSSACKPLEKNPNQFGLLTSRRASSLDDPQARPTLIVNKENQIGLTYVAVQGVKSHEGLAFHNRFLWERMEMINKHAAPPRGGGRECLWYYLGTRA
jgi:hypothetical protein